MSHLKIAVIANCCRLQVNRAIYERMAEDGWEVRIFVQADHHVALDPDTAGLPVTEMVRYGKRSRFHLYKGLDPVLSEFMPDQVLLDLEPDSLLACQLARWCARYHKRFYVQTCENQSIWSTTVNSALPVRCVITLLRHLFLWYTVPRIHHVFPISSDGKILLDGFGLNGASTLIPLGVDTQKFQPNSTFREALRQSWNVPDETPVIAYFGRLLPGKGVHLLLDALIQLGEASWMLVMDDFESEGADYLREINQQLSHPVFADRLIRIHATHAEMPHHMNAVDMVVVPSIRHGVFLEQYGRVVPEALACGTEVITSDSGSLPEVGGDVAIRFAEGSIPALVDTLSRALKISNAERRQSLSRRQDWVIRHASLLQQWHLMKPVLASPRFS
jgi:glycosyltransferase involved in cell wall biosynthesis